ncbi:MAG: hypothetical protein ABIB93_04600 [Chloroflexota bacterium]
MIWLRRMLAIVLAFVFLILTIPMLFVSRINSTVGNPEFLISELRRADVYNYIYDEVLPLAIEEIQTEGDESTVHFSQLKPYLLPMVKEIVPPAWIQEQVEQGISEVMPYMLGDTQEFSVNIPLKGRVKAGVRALEDTLHQEGVFPEIYDQLINSVLDEAASSLEGLPLSRDELKSAMTTALPSDWLLLQIDNALDEITPYLTSDKEHFTVQVDISGQMDDLEIVLTDILKKPETYDYFLDGFLVPTLKQQLQSLQLPMDTIMTDEEITGMAAEVLPYSWYQTQVVSMSGQIFAYLDGTKPTLEVAIPVADRKPVAANAIVRLVNDKLGIDVSILTAPIINGLLNGLPDQWSLDEDEVNELMGGTDDENMPARLRGWVQDGFTYTDADLRQSLGADEGTLDDIRRQIAGGLVLTEAEMRDAIAMSGADGVEELQNIDNIRHLTGLARQLLILAWLIPLLILLAIGVLGGRTWGSKLIWAASVLGMTALIVYVIVGPLFSAFVQPGIARELAQVAGQGGGLTGLITAKGVSYAQSALGSFTGGLKLQTLIALAISVVCIVLGVMWHKGQSD